jgi:hypothetical protein
MLFEYWVLSRKRGKYSKRQGDAEGTQPAASSLSTLFIKRYYTSHFKEIKTGDPCSTHGRRTNPHKYFVILPSSAYFFTAGVDGFYLHLITLRHTPQSVGLL